MDEGQRKKITSVAQTTLRCCQYSETNVMHFLFSLLRIKDLYMFRALLAHPQEALQQDWTSTPILVQPADITRTQYTKCHFSSAT
jgi:hypothetical protein